jgi:lysophospholipase L1-like esterase
MPPNLHSPGSHAGQSNPSTVACLGSSSTAGKGQAFDWVGELSRRRRNRSVRFRNFGVGGDLAFNALERVPDVVASRPDKIVVWVGGNDVLALASPKVKRFLRFWKRLPQEPSPAWFRENIRAIAERLRADSRAKIALCSLPPIGEDPASSHPVQRELNRFIGECNAIIADAARELALSYLPLNEAIHAEIGVSPSKAFTSFALLPYYRHAFRVLVLGRSLDSVAVANGWRLHTDGIHLNRRGGLIVADLVQEFIGA